jgi:PAS domain-containing protein
MSKSLEPARVMDCFPSAVLVADRDGIIRLANRRAQTLAGKVAVDLSGLHVCTGVGCAWLADGREGASPGPAHSPCPLEITILRTLEHEDRASGVEATVCLREGDERVPRISSEPLSVSDGKLVILVVDAEKAIRSVREGSDPG